MAVMFLLLVILVILVKKNKFSFFPIQNLKLFLEAKLRPQKVVCRQQQILKMSLLLIKK